MEETKWLTKTKIIIMISIVVVIGLIITFIVVHRKNLKKEYINYENQLEYAAPLYLQKEKISLKEEEWREIDVKDVIKKNLISNKRSSDCDGYIIAQGNKNPKSVSDDEDEETTDESTDENKTDEQTSENKTESTENKTESTENSDTTKEETKKKESTAKISKNVTYEAYITCKKIYTTAGYGTKPTNGTVNKQKTQTEKDTEKPKIELIGDETIVLKVGDKYEELKAAAVDNVDGDLSNKIKITGKVNTKVAGTYIIKYTVSDSSKNKATITRTVIVEEKEEVPEDNGEDDDYSDDDDYYDDDYSDDDYYDDDYSSSEDTTEPIIIFNDDSLYQTICAGNKANIAVNGIYGYIARDNVDGNITSRVQISGDTGVINTPGVYYLYYEVSDNAGNTTTATKEFTVNSCSNTIPNTTVNVPVTSVSVTPNSKVLNIGGTIKLTATVNPGNASNKTISWSSSAPSIATVDQNGNVRALKTGSVTIKATSSNNKVGACRITVQ
ncbi:MAG: DUF5011 domain-containing protein [Bacilli bacterium]|nr:DUF5011 domain-containing protein [Bacilli bacterium]MBO6194831.1 DUF5011 domain-containing protein [Bacilli bacterium]